MGDLCSYCSTSFCLVKKIQNKQQTPKICAADFIFWIFRYDQLKIHSWARAEILIHVRSYEQFLHPLFSSHIVLVMVINFHWSNFQVKIVGKRYGRAFFCQVHLDDQFILKHFGYLVQKLSQLIFLFRIVEAYVFRISEKYKMN